jgi:hypothetical protein
MLRSGPHSAKQEAQLSSWDLPWILWTWRHAGRYRRNGLPPHGTGPQAEDVGSKSPRSNISAHLPTAWQSIPWSSLVPLCFSKLTDAEMWVTGWNSCFRSGKSGVQTSAQRVATSREIFGRLHQSLQATAMTILEKVTTSSTTIYHSEWHSPCSSVTSAVDTKILNGLCPVSSLFL